MSNLLASWYVPQCSGSIEFDGGGGIQRNYLELQ